MKDTAAEGRATERIVLGAFDALLARRGDPLRYALMTDTPVGMLGLAAGEAGLCRLDYVKNEDDFLARLMRGFSDRPVIRQPAALDEARRQLDRYFSGKRLAFDLDVDLSAVTGFAQRVLKAAVRIPVGTVLTYAQIAGKAGSPRASRAAGNALHNNPVAIVVPCHRIVRTGGSIGGYGGGLPNKEWLLQHEGATLL